MSISNLIQILQYNNKVITLLQLDYLNTMCEHKD